MNRPDRLNAIDDFLPSEIKSAVELANSDRTVHVIILSGAGKGFCSGYDLKHYAEQPGFNSGMKFTQLAQHVLNIQVDFFPRISRNAVGSAKRLSDDETQH